MMWDGLFWKSGFSIGLCQQGCVGAQAQSKASPSRLSSSFPPFTLPVVTGSRALTEKPVKMKIWASEHIFK